ncbi:nucleoside hydrolase [Cohnella lubricantis]|uniref:Nucleoside hydrolase n=1 Tax=Cohnella lubricantis TaxID=2163172 RepID=A0A841TEG0_9BACL|nr:nucleoside hydrolase [Cohnella lubricantis]MBB6679813.1 nucleoside hydrolase [Cohnella lubricantis]MBP2117729.1 purine nucleosidase [Cohnella lubricantis]
MTATPIILDVDTGVDDALAIAYAIRSPEIEVLGLTTTFGNITVEEAARNSLIVLEKLGRSNVPVAKGADQPLKRTKTEYPRHIHGEHGLGGAAWSEPAGRLLSEHAADFIVRQIRSRPNELTLVFVGPLTNLALAVRKDPGIAALVNRVVIMGGAVRAPGNVSPYAEANIYSDPEAADIVFRAGFPLTVVGLDVTMKTLLPRTQVRHWREQSGELGRFFADMTEFYIDFYEEGYPGIGGCALHDPLAIGVVIDPSFVAEERMHVKVVTEGEELARTAEVPGEEPNVGVCVSVQSERFLEHFTSRVI